MSATYYVTLGGRGVALGGGGVTVVGDVQFLPGYCVLITDDPRADRLTDLPRDARRRFLASVETLAEAVEIVCARRDPAFRRVNIEIQGNYDAFLHAHVWPRYEWEGRDRVWRPVAVYPTELWRDPATALGARHDEMRNQLTAELDRLAES